MGCAQPEPAPKPMPQYIPEEPNRYGYCPYNKKTIDIIIYPNLAGEFIACENQKIQRSGALSTGSRGHLTPTGHFDVKWKAYEYDSKKYPSKNGGNNMNRALFFDTLGHAIHIGDITKTSHGCVRTRPKDANWLYEWSDIGTIVNIQKY